MRHLFCLLYFFIALSLVGCINPINIDNTSDSSNVNIDLDFSQVNNVNNDIELINKSDISDVLLEKDIKDGNLFIFTLDNKDTIYGGLKYNNKYYNLGVVSEPSPLDSNQIKLFDLNLNSSYVFGIQGIFGSHTLERNYFHIKDKVPYKLLTLSGYIIEKDLDNDDKTEFINTYGTIPTTEIYVFENNKFFVSNLNNILNAESVAFNKDKAIFEVIYKKGQSKPKLFQYDNKKLITVE